MQNNSIADSLLASAFSGLENVQTENSDAIAELLDRYGLRWKVSKQPLCLANGKETGFYGIIREDKQTCLTTCKEGFEPFQNSELAELLIRISEKTGYEIHNGGALDGGGKVYLQLNTHNEIENLGANKTTVKGYVTGINGHDGSTALKWGAVNFTVCCHNTFAMAQKALQQSARHTASIRDKVEQSIKQINGIAKQEKSIFETFIKLADVPVKAENIATIVNNITQVDITLKRDQMLNKYSSYSINRSEELLQSISREMKQKGQTLWGLFSGITHYTSHVMPAPKRDNGRVESKYTGTGLKIDNDAFTSVVNMAGLKLQAN